MNNSRFASGMGLVFAAVIAGRAGGAEVLEPFEAVEPHMGTLVRIKLFAPGEQPAEKAFRAAFRRIAELDSALSDYKPDSELNRVAKAAAGKPVPISADLFRNLSAAQELSNETQGAFDVTLGPLTHLWREARKTGRVPDFAAIEAAKKHCGYRKLHLDPEERALSLDEIGMQLDLGAIAKGDAADQALIVLRHLGIRSALIAVSGDLALGDAPPGQDGWKIGIDSIDSAGLPVTRALHLANAAVSTSGDAQQHLEQAGKRYSHILDGRTGFALTNGWTVTVVAPHGIEADATATTLSVLGCERGKAFVEARRELAAIFVSRVNGSQPHAVESSRFQTFANRAQASELSGRAAIRRLRASDRAFPCDK